MDRSEILHNVYMDSEDMHVSFERQLATPCVTTALETYFPLYCYTESL